MIKAKKARDIFLIFSVLIIKDVVCSVIRLKWQHESTMTINGVRYGFKI